NLVASMSLKQVAKRARRDHYPAPYAIIELWRDFGGDVRNVPPEHPASMRSLFLHPTARNLIRVFKLQDRLKALGKGGQERPGPGPADQARAKPGPGPDVHIQHVHVIGAGAMGGDIAAWCALRGMTVTLQDLAPERISPAIKRAADLYKKRLKEPHLVRGAMDRLLPDVKGDGV